MKKGFLIIMIPLMFAFVACDNIVNDTENDRLNIDDTAVAANDLIQMGLNSDDGLFNVNFDYTAHTVSIEVDPAYDCASIENDYSFPYDGTGWDASFKLIMDGCEGESGSSYSGSISVSLSGLVGSTGSLTSFDYTGTLTSHGTINGKVVLNIHYELSAECLMKWDCWNGTINGYTFTQLYNAYND